MEDWELIRESVVALSRIEGEHSCYYIKLSVLKLFEAIGLPSQCDGQIAQYIEDVKKRNAYETKPGFSAWIRLKTDLVLSHFPLSKLLPAIYEVLKSSNGQDIVESGLIVLTKRVIKLSNSSVVANTVIPHSWFSMFQLKLICFLGLGCRLCIVLHLPSQHLSFSDAHMPRLCIAERCQLLSVFWSVHEMVRQFLYRPMYRSQTVWNYFGCLGHYLYGCRSQRMHREIVDGRYGRARLQVCPFVGCG